MKKAIYVLILPLVVASGLVFANRDIKKETSEKPIPKPLSAAEREAERKKWEATPPGILFKKWEASPAGIKVYAAEDKIMRHITDYSDMQAVVTSLSLPPGSRLGFGVMVRINDDNYILRFDDELQQLQSLKVNDKIIIKSQSVSHAPKYAYPIISCEYAERENKIIYKHPPRKGGC